MSNETSPALRPSAAAPPEDYVSITREIRAPAALIFDAWTNAEQLMRWHAPQGCSIVFTDVNAHAGGGFRSYLVTPDGPKCYALGTYLEVERPHRLVYSMVMANEMWIETEPADLGMDPAWPRETVVTLTLRENQETGLTQLTLEQNVPDALARRTGAHPSWLSMLDQMEELLGS